MQHKRMYVIRIDNCNENVGEYEMKTKTKNNKLK